MVLSRSHSDDLPESFATQVDRLGAHFSAHLQKDALEFLHRLWTKAPQSFELLLTKVERQSLELTIQHIETVVAMIRQQITLPQTIISVLDTYLRHAPSIESAINSLLEEHAQDLIKQTKKEHLFRHSLAHALELATRSNTVLDNLDVLTGRDPISCFLRTLTTVMIQLRDYSQQNVSASNASEIASATLVINRLIAVLGIENDVDLKSLIELIANRVIVLPSTMIFSATRNMDLSELFLDFKDLTSHAGLGLSYELSSNLPVLPDSRDALMYCIDTVMLVVGVCDRNPVAMYDVVAMQAENPLQSTMEVMTHYIGQPLFLEQFFASQEFKSPFNMGSIDSINQQSFLMTMLSHLSRRVELSENAAQKDAHLFTQFIFTCRNMRLNKQGEKEFTQFINNKAIIKNMHRAINSFFFSSIEREMDCCKRESLGLVFVVNKLISMRFSPKSLVGAARGYFQPLINPQVPLIEADNLIAFKTFYMGLDERSQQGLLRELLLAVVVQAGELEAVQLGLIQYEPMKKTEEGFATNRAKNMRLFLDNSLEEEQAPASTYSQF